MELIFLPKNITYTAQTGKDLLSLAGEAGVEIDGNCAGGGTCGKCKVKILEGNDFKLTKAEEERLTDLEKQSGYRLACCFKPTEDTVTEVPLAEGAARRKTKLIQMPESFQMKGIVTKINMELTKATIEDQTGDTERLLQTCCAKRIDFRAARKLPGLLRESRNIAAVLRNDCIIDVMADSEENHCFGLAVDIGTTTVVGMLWDIISGQFRGAIAMTNPQGIYGADVISRIMYAQKGEESLRTIHEKIIFCVNDMIGQFEKQYGISQDQIYDMTVVGNTTMSHMFLGVDPQQLAMAPFAPVFCSRSIGKAKDLGLLTNASAEFYLLPNIAGHVGSDITGGIVASEFIDTEKNTLLLDVGTNGEIVLSAGGKALACSTAAGPAFEGASIYQGMRAAEGAIERVAIDEDVSIKVIGNAKPIGICGSGIIDAVAEMIKAGIVDKSGKIPTVEKLKEKGVPEPVLSRIRTGESGRELVLAYRDDAEDVVINQKDIREVQLAKAAMFAGMRIMMNTLKITEEDLDQIFIAGAFGNYIHQESALLIGLLPRTSREKIHSIGNAAGIGACMALLSAEKREEAERVAREIVHLELSACSEFQDEYIREMKFKPMP